MIKGGKTGRCCVRAPSDTTVAAYQRVISDAKDQTRYQQENFRFIANVIQFRVMKKETVVLLRQSLTDEQKDNAKESSGKESIHFAIQKRS